MQALQPYVEATDYIRVLAWRRGFQVEGVVLGWRGDRVYLTWKTDMGNHLGWLPAADVERSGGIGGRWGLVRPGRCADALAMDEITYRYPVEHFRAAVPRLVARSVGLGQEPPARESINDAIVRAGGKRPRQ